MPEKRAVAPKEFEAAGMMVKKGGGKRGLGEEDFKLWKAFTRDIEPMHEDGLIAEEDEPEAPSEKPFPASVRKKSSYVPVAPSGAPPVQAPQLDGRTEIRLKRGQMPIDGRLDLHGYTQEQAHRLLHEFITNAHARGKRCLLVITGKGGRGLDGEGILKRRLPQWLSLPPLRDMVLKVFQAAPQHGGSGAAYVYLKRQREPG